VIPRSGSGPTGQLSLGPTTRGEQLSSGPAVATDPAPSKHFRCTWVRGQRISWPTPGGAAAILDWGNAPVGDPTLDLARAVEYGGLTPDVLAA
jgi:hypothetical protein